VSRVRRKLGAAPGEPGRIRTFQGIGYLLDVEPASWADEQARDEVGVQAETALIG
jgi:DNA-binding winged helix-turn-helix (wHTH) protein